MVEAIPIVAARELCRGLSFAPFPELFTEPPATGWVPVRAVGRTPNPGADPRLTGLLQAELDETVAGPHAVHTLRSLLRERLFSTSACLYLLDRVSVFGHDSWLIDDVAYTAAGSVQHGLVLQDHREASEAEAAADLVAAVTPAVEAIRTATRVGRRTLFSYVVDTSCFAMLILARQLQHDRRRAWQRAEQWADALFAAGLPELSRPRLAHYPEEQGRPGSWGLRGACCLDFKDVDHGYCLTCPLLPYEDRERQWRAVSNP